MFRPEDSMVARSIAGFTVAIAVVAALIASPAAQRGGGAPPGPDGAPTPRMADGHPDLNGWWGGGGGGFAGGRSLSDLTDEKGNVYLQLNARSQGSALGTSSGQLAENFERDNGVGQRADANEPIYKAEFWDKVQTLDINGSHEDPTFRCGPAGVPRMGFPNKIVTGNTVKYEVIVEDPKVLQKPWVWNPRMVRLNTDPKAAFWEDPPCDDQDLEHIVTKERG
jgi:hypothetical protein